MVRTDEWADAPNSEDPNSAIHLGGSAAASLAAEPVRLGSQRAPDGGLGSQHVARLGSQCALESHAD